MVQELDERIGTKQAGEEGILDSINLGGHLWVMEAGNEAGKEKDGQEDMEEEWQIVTNKRWRKKEPKQEKVKTTKEIMEEVWRRVKENITRRSRTTRAATMGSS